MGLFRANAAADSVCGRTGPECGGSRGVRRAGAQGTERQGQVEAVRGIPAGDRRPGVYSDPGTGGEDRVSGGNGAEGSAPHEAGWASSESGVRSAQDDHHADGPGVQAVSGGRAGKKNPRADGRGGSRGLFCSRSAGGCRRGVGCKAEFRHRHRERNGSRAGRKRSRIRRFYSRENCTVWRISAGESLRRCARIHPAPKTAAD